MARFRAGDNSGLAGARAYTEQVAAGTPLEVSVKATVDAMLRSLPGCKPGKALGMDAYKVNGKMFAGWEGEALALKLPREELQRALRLQGAHLFDPRCGAHMKEWVVLPALTDAQAEALGRAALRYVQAGAKTNGRTAGLGGHSARTGGSVGDPVALAAALTRLAARAGSASARAVHDHLIHGQIVQCRLFARADHVYVAAAAQAVVRNGQQAVRVGRQVHADDGRLLVHHHVQEAGILARKPVWSWRHTWLVSR